jgi:excisionase family DNA binding protein
MESKNEYNEHAEMTAAEACRRLGVGLEFVYKLIWSGKLPARKLENTWRISSAAVEERVKQREARLAA